VNVRLRSAGFVAGNCWQLRTLTGASYRTWRETASIREAIAGAIACAALATSSTALAKDVALSIAPFAWAPAIKGELSEGPIVIPLDASVGDLAGGLKSGGMLHGEAKGERFQASLQAIYVDFHDRSFAPVMGADVRSRLLMVEMLAGPRIRQGPVELVPMAGLRYTRITGTLQAPGLGALQVGRRWSEGLAGLEASARLSPRVTLRARGVVAFAGPAGQSSADLVVAGTRQLSRGVSLALGYRWARETVRSETVDAFGLDLRAKGPVAGLIIGF
jgi:hypothetical protein